MAWYDMIRWESVMHMHSHNNTPKSLLRGIVRYCVSCSEEVVDQHLSEYAYLMPDFHPIGHSRRIIMFIQLCSPYIRNQSFSAFHVYNHIHSLLKNMCDVDETVNEAVRVTIHTIVQYVSTVIPVWYARAISLGKVKDYESNDYSNTSYDADIQSFHILRGLPIYNNEMVCMNTVFDDSDDYRKLVCEVFIENTHTIDELHTLIKEILPENSIHLRTEEWLLFARRMGYDSLTEFAIKSGVSCLTVALSSLPLDELIEITNSARDAYYEESHELHSLPFYNPLLLARGISSRQDITYDYYTNVLRKCVWWGDSPTEFPNLRRAECELPVTPHCGSPFGEIDATFISGILSTQYEHVFREFMGQTEYMKRILNHCREQNEGTIQWKSFCISMSSNCFITLDDIKTFPEIDWDWEELSRNKSIATPENITENTEFPWVWGRWGISMSPSITVGFVKDNWEKGINFGSGNRHVYPEGGTLSANYDVVTQELVDMYPEMSWDYGYNGLSCHSGITLPWLLRNITSRPWCVREIVENVIPDEELAVSAIQAWWRTIQVKRQCAWLASAVEEWWYDPDCKPASKIREHMFWDNHREYICNE